MESWEGSELNRAKEILAFELTKLVHGEEEAQKALDAARAVFGGAGSSENMPTVAVDADEIGLLDLMVLSKLAPSKGEARRLIQQGGVSVDDEKISDVNTVVTIGDGRIIRKGKKQFVKAVRG